MFDRLAVNVRQLWSHMKPEIRLQGDRTEWPSLGFQGENAATDFRGMGVFGCESLVWFGRTYPKAARRLLLESSVPDNKWFSYAITHINMSFAIVDWLLKEPRLVAPVFLSHGPDHAATFHRMTGILIVLICLTPTLANQRLTHSFSSLFALFSGIVVALSRSVAVGQPAQCYVVSTHSRRLLFHASLGNMQWCLCFASSVVG